MLCIYWRVQNDSGPLFLGSVLPSRLLDSIGAFDSVELAPRRHNRLLEHSELLKICVSVAITMEQEYLSHRPVVIPYKGC